MQKCFYYAAMHHTPHSRDPQFRYQSKQYLEKAPSNTGPQVSKFHVEYGDDLFTKDP